MTWFTRLLRGPNRNYSRSRPPGKAFRPRACLKLEGLEDRLAPANVFVVPLIIPTDGAHFHTLANALAAAGASGTVTIEPGTTPDPTGVNIIQAGVTVQGDPNVPGSILSRYDVNVVANGVVLTNLNLGNVTMGGGVGTTTVTKSLVRNLGELAATSGNGSSAITLNFFSGAVVLGGNTNGTAVSDLFANNTFASLAPVMLTLSASAGDVVSANTFTGDLSSQVAVQVIDSGTAASPITVANNTFNLGSVGGFGITASQVAGQTWANLLNNSIRTNNAGTGLLVTMNNAAGLHVDVQGNDFHNNVIGVSIRGDGGSTTLNVDLGAGVFNSLGGNNFRSFTTTGTTSAAAILLTNTPSTANVRARQNMFFTSVNPNTVIDDSTHGSRTGTGNIDTSSALTQQQSFVQALYNEVLGRSGAITTELNAWVNVLNSQGQLAVANAIVRSAESLGRIVDGFYVRFLGRTADANGRAGWISFLQNGGNLEQMTTNFVTSPEYMSKINVDYVQSLYITILGRTGASSELAAWNNLISSIGFAGVANGFSFSNEYRTNYVYSYFVNFLHRVPSTTEVAGVVALQGDILSLEVFILSSPEYFTNG